MLLVFIWLQNFGRGAENFKNQEDRLVYRLQNKVKELKNWQSKTDNKLKIEVFRADPCKENEEAGLQECMAEHFLNITYDGKLGGCPWLMKSADGFSSGSLLEEDFLVLKQKCQDEIRRKKEERKEKLSFCNECSRKQDCGRGCPGLQIKDNKLYYGLDPICPNLHSNITTKNDSKQIVEIA